MVLGSVKCLPCYGIKSTTLLVYYAAADKLLTCLTLGRASINAKAKQLPETPLQPAASKAVIVYWLVSAPLTALGVHCMTPQDKLRGDIKSGYNQPTSNSTNSLKSAEAAFPGSGLRLGENALIAGACNVSKTQAGESHCELHQTQA